MLALFRNGGNIVRQQQGQTFDFGGLVRLCQCLNARIRRRNTEGKYADGVLLDLDLWTLMPL